MPRHVYPIVLPKNEWERLKRASGPPKISTEEELAAEYVQELDLKSREMMKNWPDSIYGVVAKLDHDREKKRQKEKELLEAYRNVKKVHNESVIKSARDKIFYKSDYGRQLISALGQSKMYEEREAQIEFNKKLKRKTLKLEKEHDLKNTLEEVGKHDLENKNRSKEIYKEATNYNKEMHENNLKKIAEEKEKEIQGDLEDARLMEHLLHLEREIKNTCLDVEGIKAHEAYVLEQRERQKVEEQKQEALAKAWNEHQERVKCKTKKVMKELHANRSEFESFQKHYDLIEKLNQEQEDKYNRFVEIGVQHMEKQTQKQDEIDEKKQERKHRQLKVDANCHRLIGEIEKEGRAINKSVVDRQTLMLNIHKPRKMCVKEPIARDKSFLRRSTKLQAELSRRCKLPPPWSGLAGAHAQFADHAAGILAECRDKDDARKVVDKYRKLNCLDETSLPVANYD